jgi:aerobic C4-dicarboxylate transport protein
MRQPFYKVLYVQVLLAIAAGILLGHLYPQYATAMKPLGDAFIRLIRMIIGPVIFCTVVTGISSMSDLKKGGTRPILATGSMCRSRRWTRGQ